MIWFIQLLIVTPRTLRTCDGCDPAELAIVRRCAELVETRELVAEKTKEREEVAC